MLEVLSRNLLILHRIDLGGLVIEEFSTIPRGTLLHPSKIMKDCQSVEIISADKIYTLDFYEQFCKKKMFENCLHLKALKETLTNYKTGILDYKGFINCSLEFEDIKILSVIRV